ncbi:MAG TPA: GTP 3',8-cyclase MoaA [Thermoanaerobaculia bacterium]|jgi:cyclic pyranopterin phosphate synthase
MAVTDALGRPLSNLRLSVTDRCNLRCVYCMPEADYAWLPREEILTFEEIARLSSVFARLGVDRLRLTGGEPLLRRDLPRLIAMLASERRLREIAMTTNGVLLSGAATDLARAGLTRVTVSLDTLDAGRFHAMTRRDDHAGVLAGIDAAVAAGLTPVKLDAVIVRGVNEDELVPLLDYGRSVGAEIRFIEYMDVGGATHWKRELVVSRAEMLEAIARGLGPPMPVEESTTAPAERFRLPDGRVFGIIASVTAPFCRRCDRSRLTADGLWLTCLYATKGLDLRGPLRAGASDEEIAGLLAGGWGGRTDRGAEQRLALRGARAAAPVEELRQDPHREMHTRGG